MISAMGDIAKDFLSEDIIHIIAHHDADGLSAAAIMTKALLRLKKRFTLTVVAHLTQQKVQDLHKESNGCFLLVDIGSSMMHGLNELERRVYILDHHLHPTEPKDHIREINPWNHAIDGAKEISAAGIAYLFAKTLDKQNTDLAYLAIIGATGDIQTQFISFNKDILDEAITQKQIEVKEDLLFYGAYSKPLYKVLQYTTSPFIPGVSGSELGAMKLLKSCNIPLKKGDVYTKLHHLTDIQKTMLINKMMERNPRLTEEDLVGNVYLLAHQKRDSPLRDAREFATLLNGCGRLNKPSYAIGACLKDKKMVQRALEEVGEYKRQLVSAFSWFEKQKHSEDVVIKDYCIIFNARDNIPSSLLSVVTTIIAHSTIAQPNTFVLGMARDGDLSKVSLRLSKGSDEYDLMNIIAGEKRFVTSGGHKRSAGGLVYIEDEDEFVQAMEKRFSDRKLEETV